MVILSLASSGGPPEGYPAAFLLTGALVCMALGLIRAGWRRRVAPSPDSRDRIGIVRLGLGLALLCVALIIAAGLIMNLVNLVA
jgi:hypothetical protein